jgi:hypothetical protein
MLVAALLLAVGFFSVAYATQTRGLRMGGTIVVPLTALYTLKNFAAFPVFLVSFALAYAALWAAKQYTLVYGRDELIVAIVAGSLLPLGLLFLGETVGLEVVSNLRAALFLGSILPGLAAYNVQQLKPEYRRQDAVFSVGIYVVVVLLGVLLVDPRLVPVLGTATPPVLFAETSDIALARGAVVDAPLQPLVLPRSLAVTLLVVAFFISEWGRDRFGIRAGVVSMGLLAVYASVNEWLVVLFLALFIAVLFTISFVHTVSLLYGRVLIGIGGGVGSLLAVPLVLGLPIVRGLSATIVAILAATTAYNAHVTAPQERRMRVPLALVIFAPLFVASRVLGVYSPSGLFAAVPVTPWLAVGAALLVVGSYLLLRRFRIEQPSDEAVLSASVLSGGDG